MTTDRLNRGYGTTHREADDAIDLTGALEQQVDAEEEAAKRAIREYKNTIRNDNASEGARQIESRLEVEKAVNRYMQLRRKLDELRLQTNASQMPSRPS